MRVGISTACFYPQPVEEILPVLAGLGVHAIEIFFNTESEFQPRFYEELGAQARGLGLDVVSVHPYTSLMEGLLLFSDYKRRTEDGLMQYQRYFECAAALGARYLTFHGERFMGQTDTPGMANSTIVRNSISFNYSSDKKTNFHAKVSNIYEIIEDNIVRRKDNKNNIEQYNSTGFRYAMNLFYCVLLFYFDRFHMYDEMAVKKLFAWAMMIRVDMENLGFDTITNYAIGNEDKDYTNHIPMFFKIATARRNQEIANLRIQVIRTPDRAKSEKWNALFLTDICA